MSSTSSGFTSSQFQVPPWRRQCFGYLWLIYGKGHQLQIISCICLANTVHGSFAFLDTSLFTAVYGVLCDLFLAESHVIHINPFAYIGRTGTSKAKVEVRDICLNISFLAWFKFFSLLYEKKFKVSSKKKGLLIYLSSIKTELAIN